MAAMQSRYCVDITIIGNDVCYCYIHLQMFVVYVQNTAHASVKKNQVDLIHVLLARLR